MASLELRKFDPRSDRKELEEVARWCEQFSPAVAIEDPDCLFMDVTGLVPIFGSEQALIADMRRKFNERRLQIHAAITDTYAGSWALAHFSGLPGVIATPGQVYDAISDLPVAALNLPETVSILLNELGIETIGQLSALPRASLAARFDPILLDRLDQTLGHIREVVTPYRAPAELERTFDFENCVSDRCLLGNTIVELLAQVIPLLANLQKGITRCAFEFISEESPPIRMSLGLYQACCDIKHLSELALLQLEGLRFVSPVDQVRLLVYTTAQLETTQLGLFEEEDLIEQKKQLTLLVNRLGSRLGPEAVLQGTLVADAHAEFAYRYRPFIDRPRPSNKKRSSSTSHSLKPGLERPLRLLPQTVPLEVLGIVEGPPSQFRWQGKIFQVGRSWGPERIKTGWWRGGYVQRDYYRVETATGNRYWLFRRGDGAWFLHGIFD